MSPDHRKTTRWSRGWSILLLGFLIALSLAFWKGWEPAECVKWLTGIALLTLVVWKGPL